MGNDQTIWLMEAEVFYRCPECGETHTTTYTAEDRYSTQIEGIIAYLCECGHGVAVVQTRVKALEIGGDHDEG